MENTKINLNEFVKLIVGLHQRGISFNTIIGQNSAILIVCDRDGIYLWDAAINPLTYGSERGLLEVKGQTIIDKISLSEEPMDVIGWLTADEILEKI